MTRALAKELGPSGITVNAIAPGLIDTDMNKSLSSEDKLAFCEDTPVSRMGKPEEVAAAAVYLASECASFVSGDVLNVNGAYIV
jgi:3-oxoacyl-[acyl-carrier protein] reductase